jgi:hypothetical protein
MITDFLIFLYDIFFPEPKDCEWCGTRGAVPSLVPPDFDKEYLLCGKCYDKASADYLHCKI